MNWANERANAVVNSIGFRENPEAAIAEALQGVADEAADCVESAPLDCKNRGRYHFADVIRARFPQEGRNGAA